MLSNKLYLGFDKMNGKNSKIISLKVQYYLGAIPFIGVAIVFFIGVFNVYAINRNRKFVWLYYLFIVAPLALFCGIFAAVFLLFIVPIVSMTLKITLALILSFIIQLCVAFSIITIQKCMLEKLKKQAEKQIENNLY